MMKIDWAHPDWSYLLGVVHGDGTIAPRSVTICVGYRDTEYADVLCGMLTGLGLSPKRYRGRTAMVLAVHSKELRDQFAPFKLRGRWSWPDRLSTPDYVAGVIDTDGCVSIPASKHISIVLKRSGNLRRVVPMLVEIGVREPRVVAFSNSVRLRNPRKAERLALMRSHVDVLLARVPLWRRIGLWLQEEPRTWEQIAEKFSITKSQVDSALENLRRYATVETIPPPKALSRFRVSGL